MASTTGGGATHIAKSTGLLRELSLSNLLLASGGGGGANENSNGEDAGGISGSGTNSANQTTGYMFGQGEYNLSGGGGGGGLYGGFVDCGAGSGFIGNQYTTNKKMVGYNVPISSDENTKTESSNNFGKNTSDTPQIGNGFARIMKKILPSDTILYGFRWSGRDVSNPANIISYLADNKNFESVHMDYSQDKFIYGSWENAFFMPKPCILNLDGSVRCFLNPNDYSKDTDGNSVDISSNLSNANVMLQFPKIWFYAAPEDDKDSTKIFISNYQINDGFKDYAYIDINGVHKEYFYISPYFGYLIDGKTRSVSGVNANANGTLATMRTRARNNGAGWDANNAGIMSLLDLLIILMAKNTNSQLIYGKGKRHSSTLTGTQNSKGLFYGTNVESTGVSNTVKILGIEDYIGGPFDKYNGDINANKTLKVKMCYGYEDGSSVFDYNSSGDGYVSIGTLASDGWIKFMGYTKYGLIYARQSGGSDSTFMCDYVYTGSGTNIGCRGYNNNNDSRLNRAGIFRRDRDMGDPNNGETLSRLTYR